MPKISLIPTAEVVRILGVNVKTVTRWASEGTLPHVQKLPGLRGPYLFDAAAVARFKSERDAERKKAS